MRSRWETAELNGIWDFGTVIDSKNARRKAAIIGKENKNYCTMSTWRKTETLPEHWRLSRSWSVLTTHMIYIIAIHHPAMEMGVHGGDRSRMKWDEVTMGRIFEEMERNVTGRLGMKTRVLMHSLQDPIAHKPWSRPLNWDLCFTSRIQRAETSVGEVLTSNQWVESRGSSLA